ncbi:hypothetical protein LguiA_034991 [Lonicera macranthoides]
MCEAVSEGAIVVGQRVYLGGVIWARAVPDQVYRWVDLDQKGVGVIPEILLDRSDLNYRATQWEIKFGGVVGSAINSVILLMEPGHVIFNSISSGAVGRPAKWLHQSGLVVLLASYLDYGYDDGLGPQHSSLLAQRMGNIMSDDNPCITPEIYGSNTNEANLGMQLAGLNKMNSFSHNVHHNIISRSQINKESRKPLIVLSPNDLLGHKEASLIYISKCDDVQGHPGFDKQGD